MSRNRSVNDFDTPEGLRAALKSQSFCGAYSDTARRRNDCFSAAAPKQDDDDEDESMPTEQLDWVLTNYNAELSQTQSLQEELKRLQVLRSYLLLDSEREPTFERLTALAGRMFHVPIALVSLVDLGRQWFMSNRGLGDARETPRSQAFCAHTILSVEDVLIVPNATLDARFCDNPLVTGPPHIRFYAGAPLKCPETGYKLGTFCIIDSKPREGLTLEEKQNLRELADLAVDAMVERKRHKVGGDGNDKSHMIACTAHDLLTPLSGVQMSLSLLLEDSTLTLSPSQAELLTTAASCTNVMNRICQHAIDSFRTTKQQDTPHPKGHVVVEEMVQNLKLVMEPYPKSVPVYITVDPTVPPIILSDDLKLFRCCVNYLTNACKQTTKGSVHLQITQQDKNLVVECHDTGPGVPLQQYPYLFRPFHEETSNQTCGASSCIPTGDNSTPQQSAAVTMDNSGLGLYSVASQISSIGGDYGFRPRDNGDGAIFWFSIPLHTPSSPQQEEDEAPTKPAPVAQAQAQSHTTLTQQAETTLAQRIQDLSTDFTHPDSKMSPEHHPTKHRTRRALVIDDSIVIRKSLSRALSTLGFDVTTAINGLEGLQELKARVYDVVFCDFLMPVMDGLDCVQQYRDWECVHRNWIRQYICGISAHASDKDVEKGLEAGMDAYKAKPVTLQVLKEFLETNDEMKRVGDTLDNVLLDLGKHARSEGMEQGRSEKRIKVDDDDDDVAKPVCLVGENTTSVTQTMSDIMRSKWWNPVVVNDGEDALRLLKMRNWEAVFLDQDLPRLDGIRVVERFREWEREHRVARQKHIFLVSESFVPNPGSAISAVVYPAGFDGALGKPVLPADLVGLLDKAAQKIAPSSDSSDIVAR